MVKDDGTKTVLIYKDENGKEPFADWLAKLRDIKGRRAILKRVMRLEYGLYGDCKNLGDGIAELRIFTGPGYRVYFGEKGDHIVIILCGGDKSTQRADIKKAKDLWKDYQDGEKR